ncbi:hypothetical protein GRJ2_000042900 [Grus japonensis]|uniref:Uncharacterized protein n=1 Tax=Grus japonensis TaxID=30415 RepID=A0ABC9VVE2_GRUJA
MRLVPLPSHALDQQDTEHMENIKRMNNPIDFMGTTRTLKIEQMAGTKYSPLVPPSFSCMGEKSEMAPFGYDIHLYRNVISWGF